MFGWFFKCCCLFGVVSDTLGWLNALRWKSFFLGAIAKLLAGNVITETLLSVRNFLLIASLS